MTGATAIVALLLALGQPGMDLWPCTIVAMAVWAAVLPRSSAAGATLSGATVGVVYALPVAVPVLTWGPAGAAALIAMFAAWFASWAGLARAVLRWAGRAPAAAAALGLLWMLAETVVTQRVPWALGMSMTATPALLWPVSVLGAGFLGGELVALGAFLGLGERPGLPRRAAVVAGALVLQAAVGVLIAPGSSEGTVHVAGLQPRISTRDYRQRLAEPDTAATLEEKLLTLFAGAAERGPRVVVAPEGADGRFTFLSEQLSASVRDLATAYRTDLVVPTYHLDDEGRLLNAAHLVRADGSIAGPHVKTTPVPFGEDHVRAGTAPRMLEGTDVRLGVTVCVEGTYRRAVRELVEQGAELLVLVANDASFDRSWVAEWHAQLAVLRAVEAGRDLLFVSNAGPSRLTDAGGFVRARAEFGRAGFIGGVAARRRARSAYARIEPAVPAAGLIVLGLLLAAPLRRASGLALSAPAGLPTSRLASVGVGIAALGTAVAVQLLGPRLQSSLDAEVWTVAEPVTTVARRSERASSRSEAFAAAVAQLLRYYGFQVDRDAVEERMQRAAIPIDGDGAVRLLASWGLEARIVTDPEARIEAHQGPLLGEASTDDGLRPGITLGLTGDRQVRVYDPQHGGTRTVGRGLLGALQQWSVQVVGDAPASASR